MRGMAGRRAGCRSGATLPKCSDATRSNRRRENLIDGEIRPLRILLDAGIIIHSEFMEPAVRDTTVHWGDKVQSLPVHGFVRKVAHPDNQPEYDALFTVGRLIRERLIEAYTYDEVHFEVVRGKGLLPDGNALQNCNIRRCSPALERSKFTATTDFMQMFSKGGKKDRKDPSARVGPANQIPFLQFLRNLEQQHVELLIEHPELIGLTTFGIDNLKSLAQYKFLCQRWDSPDNYPDVFHLWTAERNGLDVLLTLDKGLPELVRRVTGEKSKKITVRTKVFRPLDFLKYIGVGKPDPVPFEYNRFYHLHEL
jgi:hypothetical protein